MLRINLHMKVATAMKHSLENLQQAVLQEKQELLWSFVAGGAYIAIAMAGSAIAVKGVAGLARTALPAMVESMTPPPKYAANQLPRAERFNEAVVASWEFDTASK